MNVAPVSNFNNASKIRTKLLAMSAAGLGVNALSNSQDTTCKKTSDTIDNNGVRTIKRSMPFYTDLVGLFHKKDMEIKIDNESRTRTLKEINIDGSQITRVFKSDSQHRVLERVCTKCLKSGVVEFYSSHKSSYQDGKQITHITNKDFRNNTETFVTKINEEFQSEIRKVTDPKTGKVKTEILEKSPVKGVLNSKTIDENGNIKIESMGIKNPDGSYVVKKDFESIDGTRTKYFYKNDNENSELHYQIISKNGEVLSTVDRVYKKISPQKVFYSLNGHGYAINNTDNGIEIRDLLSNDIKQVSYKDIIRGEDDMNEETMKFVRSLPADMILNLYNNNYKIYTVDDPKDGSKFDNEMIKTTRNWYTLAHELGHGLDYSKENDSLEKITRDKSLRSVYEEEKANFLNTFSDIQQDYISYFLMDMCGVRGTEAGISESVAESNALLMSIPEEQYLIRSHYYQKYFPKTIAAASKLLLNDKIVKSF